MYVIIVVGYHKNIFYLPYFIETYSFLRIVRLEMKRNLEKNVNKLYFCLYF